jgi:hypothetical protein
MALDTLELDLTRPTPAPNCANDAVARLPTASANLHACWGTDPHALRPCF